jgi:hypothetical protein
MTGSAKLCGLTLGFWLLGCSSISDHDAAVDSGLTHDAGGSDAGGFDASVCVDLAESDCLQKGCVAVRGQRSTDAGSNSRDLPLEYAGCKGAEHNWWFGMPASVLVWISERVIWRVLAILEPLPACRLVEGWLRSIAAMPLLELSSSRRSRSAPRSRGPPTRNSAPACCVPSGNATRRPRWPTASSRRGCRSNGAWSRFHSSDRRASTNVKSGPFAESRPLRRRSQTDPLVAVRGIHRRLRWATAGEGHAFA